MIAMGPSKLPSSPYLFRKLRTLREVCDERARRTGLPPPCDACRERPLCLQIERKARPRLKTRAAA
jgi:hypothetical protein